MIATVQPLAAGNALRLFLAPPAGAVRWRVLRKGDDTFTDVNDPEAIIAYEGDERVAVDADWLQNDVAVHYRPFYQDADGNWTAGATAIGTPVASYAELSTDVLPFLRDRLEAGLQVELERGEFQSRIGHIQVFTSPPSLEGSIRWPVVTVHLDNEAPAVRAIGEDAWGDEIILESDGDAEWLESEGWINQVQITVIAWSLNADERIDLGRALRRIIVANLPVFESRGITQIEFRAQHVDALSGEYPVNLYQVLGSFTCLAPVRVGSEASAIRAVETQVGVSAETFGP